MRLTRLDIRFFRSFNFDYEYKARSEHGPAAWEDRAPDWYPFVQIDIEPHVTAVVGANEAGKSQLLTALKAAITGSPIERSDFCRYSALFSVEKGAMRLPEFGCTFVGADQGPVQLGSMPPMDEFTFYRPGAGAPFIVTSGERRALSPEDLAQLSGMLPKILVLRTDLALPDSVSIDELSGKARHVLQDRQARTKFLEAVRTAQSLADEATARRLQQILTPGQDEASLRAEEKRAAEVHLARQLLVDVAGIDVEAFTQLQDALDRGSEGEVEAGIGGMNAALQKNLNVQRWWSQDKEFDLRVEAREREVAFTIRDRTNSKYSFQERSQGLRYFLSYFVQLAADRLKQGKADILLLDEPDAFLSSVGQQDLLRVLNDYATPEDGSPQSQVVYVTHSPFLIDKNAPHIIRVLDKGSQDEGTRVVRDAANNRYEPLRSSLGGNLSETAFIGGRNLFVEGIADQILLTGVSTHITKVDQSAVGVFDLNKVTVVASNGADGVPYMVYLARGRDAVKPPCVALVDGDQAGRDAERVLKRGEARKKRVLKDEYILRIDQWAEASGLSFDAGVKVEEIEDLVPLALSHRAAINYLARFQDLAEIDLDSFTVTKVRESVAVHDGSSWKGLQAAFMVAFPDEHLEKAGLAREVLNLVSRDENIDGAAELRSRFESLLTVLLERLDQATEEEEANRYDDRFKRTVQRFLGSNPTGMRKFDARSLVRELEHSLGESRATDAIRTRLYSITRDFDLKTPGDINVPRFEDFRAEIGGLQLLERVTYQDDARVDPSAQVLSKTGRGSKK